MGNPANEGKDRTERNVTERIQWSVVGLRRQKREGERERGREDMNSVGMGKRACGCSGTVCPDPQCDPHPRRVQHDSLDPPGSPEGLWVSSRSRLPPRPLCQPIARQTIADSMKNRLATNRFSFVFSFSTFFSFSFAGISLYGDRRRTRAIP